MYAHIYMYIYIESYDLLECNFKLTTDSEKPQASIA